MPASRYGCLAEDPRYACLAVGLPARRGRCTRCSDTRVRVARCAMGRHRAPPAMRGLARARRCERGPNARRREEPCAMRRARTQSWRRCAKTAISGCTVHGAAWSVRSRGRRLSLVLQPSLTSERLRTMTGRWPAADVTGAHAEHEVHGNDLGHEPGFARGGSQLSLSEGPRAVRRAGSYAVPAVLTTWECATPLQHSSCRTRTVSTSGDAARLTREVLRGWRRVRQERPDRGRFK